jgi:hypothetical protein
MATHHVMRRNRANAPPRFEYLRNRPDFTPAGAALPDGTVATEDTVTARWTWIDSFVDGVPQWRNGNPPHDFGRNKAERWAALIDGARAVRFGDDDSLPTAESESRRAARQAYKDALAKGEEPL